MDLSLNPGRVNDFPFYMLSRPPLGSIQPPIEWVAGGILPGVKRSEHEINHSLADSAEVKKMWIYTATPSHAFMP
jgi:hypothetical protein